MIFEYPDEIERLPGSTPFRQKMAADAIVYLDNLAADSSGDASLRAELAAAYAKVGDIQGNPYYANLGDMDGALASYNKAFAIRRELAAADPENTKLALDLSLSLGSLGDLYWAKGDYPNALDKYKQALAIADALAAADPSDHTRRYALGHRHYYVGQTQRKMGDREGALASFGRSLAINLDLLSAEPGNADYRQAVAVAYLKTGDVYFDAADPAAALSFHQKASDTLTPLAEQSADATAKRELALFLNRIAADRRSLGDLAGAVASDTRAIAIQQEIARLDPLNEQSNLDLANYQHSLAESYLRLGKRTEAAALLKKAVAVYEASLRKNPSDAEVAEYMATARRLLAGIDAGR